MYLPPLLLGSKQTQQALAHINAMLAVLIGRELVTALHVIVCDGTLCMSWNLQDMSLLSSTPWAPCEDHEQERPEFLIEVLITCAPGLVLQDLVGLVTLFGELDWHVLGELCHVQGVITMDHFRPLMVQVIYSSGSVFGDDPQWSGLS